MNHAFAYVTYITFPPARLLVFPSMQSVGSIRYVLSVSGDDVLYVSGGLSIFGVRYKQTSSRQFFWGI